MRKLNKKKRLALWIGIASVAVAILGYNTFANMLRGGSGESSRTTRDVALSCTTDAFTTFHIHPRLEIIADGTRQEIPQNIGISLTCMHPLHTHDTTGEIHIESPVKRDFELADFFAVWDKPFSRDEILGFKADGTHEIVLTVNGERSDAYERLVLRDKDHIVIEYREIN